MATKEETADSKVKWNPGRAALCAKGDWELSLRSLAQLCQRMARPCYLPGWAAALHFS